MPRKAIDPAGTVIISARMTTAMVEALRRVADRDERTLSQMVHRIVREHLEGIGELPERNRAASVAKSALKQR